MKVLAVLVLAVFTGCNANVFYADAPKPQLEVLTDAFWEYVAKATQTADDTLQMIKKTEFGQEMSARLAQGSDVANQYALTLHEQLPPAAKDLIITVSAEADALKQHVTVELNSIREKLEPYTYTENMRVQVQQRVDQLQAEINQLLAMDPETLKTELVRRTEELKANLEQSVADLQAQLGPHTDDLKQRVDQHLLTFKERVSPLAEKVQMELTQRAQQVRDLATPYVGELRETLDPYAQDLQDRLIALYQSFVTTN
ncbi:apolipoprotein A-IV-like [Entelurus aequoreus]|uniref:apolipoprotein A-IV-like n=1 Tax=Entelurus aequoreus TaxID=161455 RepID=UPI002B1D2077|nr:apolipoprotein A-IV-like [Entelurus aequoreus]